MWYVPAQRWEPCMADVAYDVSGPASPKPGDIAPQQASRPDSPDRGKLRVFISYSRDDLHFADQLDAALNACGFECVMDRHGISGGEDWKRRLGLALLATCATVIGWRLKWDADRSRHVAEEQRAVAEKQRTAAQEQRAVAEEQRQQADHILEGATNIFRKSRDRMDLDAQKEAFTVFKAGADHGDGASMNILGWLYNTGFGVVQDYARAREWYEKAIDKGNVNAMANLGALYDNGYGVAQDYAKAREWYEKAVDKGHGNAMTTLGALYARGQGVAKDYAKARELFEKAADKGDAGGMFGLGALYANGYGVAKDYAKAREWYEKAADKGDEGARARLKQLPIVRRR